MIGHLAEGVEAGLQALHVDVDGGGVGQHRRGRHQDEAPKASLARDTVKPFTILTKHSGARRPVPGPPSPHPYALGNIGLTPEE